MEKISIIVCEALFCIGHRFNIKKSLLSATYLTQRLVEFISLESDEFTPERICCLKTKFFICVPLCLGAFSHKLFVESL